ncbi:MAG: tetratricopeptide repeat protein, partial [Cyanobacteria bacterium P01_C01_bin.118]
MSTQQKIKQYGQRWLALACLGSLGWLGLSVPQVPARAQASQQMCIDNIGFYHRNQVTVRANWGREALRKDRIQPAADHLAKALDFARAIKDVESRSLIYEDFIATNSGSTGWLVHEVNRLIELDQTVAVRTVLVPARRAAEELPTGDSTLKIRMLTTIANHYTAIGDRATALDLLSQARQLVTHVQGTEIKANILTTLAQSYGTAGDSTIATEVVTDALQQAEKVEYGDSSRRDQTIAPIAVVYAEAGNIEQAMTLAQSLEQPYYRENSIGAAALAAARLGQLDRATELVQLLTLEQPLIRTLTEIGLQLAETGDTDQSQQYFDQAIKVIQTEGYPGPSFTNAMVNAGFTETVLAALSAAPEGRITVDGLLDLAQHHTEAGNSKAAGNVLRQAM